MLWRWKRHHVRNMGQSRNTHFVCAPHHHFQTQRAALSLPCNPTRGDASEGMRKRRQGVFKKSFHSAVRHPRPCSRGLQDVPHPLPEHPTGCAWVVAEDAPSRVLKWPSPPQCSCFYNLETPTLPKAQANTTKTRVMIRQGFLHLVSACLHHANVKQQCKKLLLAVGQGWQDNFFSLTWGINTSATRGRGQGKAQGVPDAELPSLPIRGYRIFHTIQTAPKHVSGSWYQVYEGEPIKCQTKKKPQGTYTSAAHTKTSQESSLPKKLQCTRNRRSLLSHGNPKCMDFFFMCEILLNIYLEFIFANRHRNEKHAEVILEALGVFVHYRDIPTRHTNTIPQYWAQGTSMTLESQNTSAGRNL